MTTLEAMKLLKYGKKIMAENDRLQAEVKRLIKLGDGLDDALEAYFQLLPFLLSERQAKAFINSRKASAEWHHATKGGLKS